MKLNDLENKKILIVGRGEEGKAAFSFLKTHFPKIEVDIVDVKDGENYLDIQNKYDIAIKSPGIKSEKIKIPYTTLINIFLSNAKGKVIGVTGTKGKSTTSTLIYLMLKEQGKDAYLGGNIGKSPLDFLDKLSDQSWTVLEMSSFQLKDLNLSPHIAVILMITLEHLDYHIDYNEYVEAKRNILKFQTPNDFSIVSRDYPASNESDVHTEGKAFKTSRERECDEGCYVRDEAVWIKKDGKEEKIIDVSNVKLLGKHNLENVCAAVMAAILCGVSTKNIVSVLKTFGGLEHRLEFVGEREGIKFYNDSLATIPEATIEALEALPNTETLITGGFDRGLDYGKLGKYLSKSRVKTLILFPETGKKIWNEIRENKGIEKFDVTSMKKAVEIAFAETTHGKICLLSPASASFGLFKNYKDRGDQFKHEVLKQNS